jgi:hypothetical protein
MPRPPIIPQLDWQALFATGVPYATWIQGGESPDNRARMEDFRQSLQLEPQVLQTLASLPRPVRVLAIAEDWCGDVVRHVPVLARLEDAAPHLEVRFITRDQHPEVFVRFLTNGGEAIPKFIFLSANWIECGNWGALPEACRELIARGKACGDVPAARRKVSAQYEADPGRKVVIEELMHLLAIASALEP